MDDAIVVRKVSKQFKIQINKKDTLFEQAIGFLHQHHDSDEEEFVALNDISFSVKRGESIGIIGENGSGKSTLLKIVAGVLKPDEGDIETHGKIASLLELGVGFQPELTGEDNVKLYGTIMGLSRQQISRGIDDIFEFAELEKFRYVKLKNYSSGMYARLAFATAASTDPDIFLIDEVLSVGDEAFQKKCFDKIDEIKRAGKAIVLVSHDLNTVKKNCKQSIFLEHGKIRFIGSTEKVIHDYHKYMEEKDLKNFENGAGEYADSSMSKNAEKDRWGTKEIEIIDIKTLDIHGNGKKIFENGEKIRFQINYRINRDFLDPTFGIGFFTNDGTYIFGTTTKIDGFEMNLSNKNGHIYLDVDNLFLAGLYLVTVGVWSGDNWISPYDVHDKKYKFKIIFDEDRDGIIQIPSKWGKNRSG